MTSNDNLLGLDPRQIAVIGEYTTPSGPVADDYFLVVITWTGCEFNFPMGTIDDIALRRLETAIGTTLELGLANRTDFSSRVVYPSVLVDQPLFEFQREKFSFSALLRSLKALGLTWPTTHHLASEVQRYLAANAGELK